MMGSRRVALVCSILLCLHCANGFSNMQPLTLGRSKNVDMRDSFCGLAAAPLNKKGTFMKQISFHRMSATDESEGEGNAEADGEALDNKVAGRKKRLTLGYQAAALSYVATALYGLYSWGSLSASALYYAVGGGPLNMAVILYILKGAAVHDRLGSDTYKRLNMAVVSYALIQLLIPTGAAGWAGRVSLTLPGFLALVNGIKGYGYGVLGWDKSKGASAILTDIRDGVGSTPKGLANVKVKSLGYMLGTLLLGSMFCLKLNALVRIPLTAAERVTRLSKLARFGLISSIMYTLKDACDRDRLSGTTFVQLNLMAAAAFFSISLYLLPTYGTALANTQIVVAGGLFAMTLFHGLTSKKA